MVLIILTSSRDCIKSKWSKLLKTSTPGHVSHSVNIGWIFFFHILIQPHKKHYSTHLAFYHWYSAKARRPVAARKAMKIYFFPMTKFWMFFLGCWCVHSKWQSCFFLEHTIWKKKKMAELLCGHSWLPAQATLLLIVSWGPGKMLTSQEIFHSGNSSL